ncbi:hypothetical protein Golomagni_03104 [Golovinomyces magnicellulatus]|nr:hypothetical protein Golomagni_03104 [Golovinomyces magnicellulatus]
MSGSNTNFMGKRLDSPELKSETIKINWIDGIDPNSSPNKLSNYVAAKCEDTDEDLHELLELDFENWDSNTF